MTRRDAGRGEAQITVFGRHPVSEAIRSEGSEVCEVSFSKGKLSPEHRALRHEATRAGLPVDEITREEMTRRTGAPRHDQGIAARVRLLRVIEVESFVEVSKGRRAQQPSRLVALDGVTNSQNVGMVVRSVVGAGLDGVLWPLVRQPWINGLVVRAAAGAIFDCPIIRCETLSSGLATLQAAGFECIGLESEAQASLFQTKSPHRAVYVLGSESTGLSPEILEQLDRRVSIPMAGPLESLNVAVAAGLVCFHAAGLCTPD